MASRDYLALPLGTDTLVVTCDSIGGIGNKELDALPAPPQVVGRFLARVALMELLATGASLKAMSCTFAVDPISALPILDGIYTEARYLHHSPASITVMTTEKNMPTRQTGVGLTCIGQVSGQRLRSGLAEPGDLVLALGRPKVGAEVSIDDPDNADIPKLQKLLSIPGVKDIAPAGSKGLLYEAETIAESAGLCLALESAHSALLHKSAGPATAVVLACTAEAYWLVAKHLNPLLKIGTLKEDIK